MLKEVEGFKFSNGYTDFCNHCYTFSKINKPSEIDKKIHENHVQLAQQQKQKLKDLKNNLKKKEIIIEFDFKENLKIGCKGKIQKQKNFFNQQILTTFGVVTYFRNSFNKLEQK